MDPVDFGPEHVTDLGPGRGRRDDDAIGVGMQEPAREARREVALPDAVAAHDEDLLPVPDGPGDFLLPAPQGAHAQAFGHPPYGVLLMR